jgi:hypothetical protein
MTRPALLALTLLLAATGCAAPTAPGEHDQLAEARALWKARGSDSYTIELNRSCFCVLAGRRMTVTVKGGAVVGADYLEPSGPVDQALLTYVPTVSDLFDLIQDALDKKAASFLASYDPIYGFPTRIEVDYSANIRDDEMAISASGYAPLRQP